MGRAFKFDQYAVLFDFDNKKEGDLQNFLNLAEQLDMDQYDAPKQYTPSGALHYTFYVGGRKAKRIGSCTGITYEGVTYATDAKFKNGLCKCQPSTVN